MAMSDASKDPSVVAAMVDSELPDVTVGVITTPNRRHLFTEFLERMVVSMQAYSGGSSILVANNGGAEFHSVITEQLEAVCSPQGVGWRVLNSPENNIAVARNLIIDGCDTRYLAFVDDDELSSPSWLIHLMAGAVRWGDTVTAGPVHAMFPDGTVFWVREMDLHNTRRYQTGDIIGSVGSGNMLLDLDAVGSTRFNEQYGKSGGSDTEFSLRLGQQGARIRWVKEAELSEHIPAEKSTVKATLRRCYIQGANYRRILVSRDELGSELLFSLRAVLVGGGALVVALVLWLVRSPLTGDWLKRAFSNFGKLDKARRQLYS